MNIDVILNSIRFLKQQTKQVSDSILVLKHTESNIVSYLNRSKKISLQSLDVLNELEKQLNFLKNENNSYEQRKKLEERRRHK